VTETIEPMPARIDADVGETCLGSRFGVGGIRRGLACCFSVWAVGICALKSGAGAALVVDVGMVKTALGASAG
jgi:hypothetical protein